MDFMGRAVVLNEHCLCSPELFESKASAQMASVRSVNEGEYEWTWVPFLPQ